MTYRVYYALANAAHPAPNKWGVHCQETDEILYFKEVMINASCRTENFLGQRIPQWVIRVDNAELIVHTQADFAELRTSNN